MMHSFAEIRVEISLRSDDNRRPLDDGLTQGMYWRVNAPEAVDYILSISGPISLASIYPSQATCALVELVVR